MTKRNYVDEILSKKKRLAPTSRRWEQLSNRLNRITSIVDFLDFLEPSAKLDEFLEKYADVKDGYSKFENEYSDIQYEVSRYIPTGLIACTEGYFRLVYADLINHGAPFRDNIAKFEIKFSLEMALSLEQHSVSLGEFVSHLLPTNNLEDINNNMTAIIGNDFLRLFRQMRPKLDRQQKLFQVDEEEISNRIIASVRRLFEFRHMYCHEIDPPIYEEDRALIWRGSHATVEFLWASEGVINELLSNKPSV